MEELAKLDLLRERFGLTYKEAKEALDQAGGDVIQALIELEEKQREEGGWAAGFEGKGREVIGQLKAAWQKSKETRIKVKKGDKTVVEIPAPLGALGILGALASTELALIGFLGAATALAKKYSLELDRGTAKDLADDFAGEEPLDGENIH